MFSLDFFKGGIIFWRCENLVLYSGFLLIDSIITFSFIVSRNSFAVFPNFYFLCSRIYSLYVL